jgi:ferric-dicitrate binding protein FerR (iron transport regulator)
MQEITDELIEKFFNGHCSREEAARVYEYLKNHPGNDYLLNEWENTDGITPLPPGYSAEMLHAIIDNHAGRKRTFFTSWKPFIAAAACLLVLWGGWWLWQRSTGTTPLAAAQQPVQPVAWKTIGNQRTNDSMLWLPDGSSIGLAPRSWIRYRTDFNRYGKREIILSGAALFTVAASTQQPFVVYSEGIATTVLGTRFSITAFTTASKVTVHLFEGRVKVSTDSAQAKNNTAFYLEPGDELVYDKRNKRAWQNKARTMGRHIPDTGVAGHREQPEAISNWYMFDNQHLAQVFDQLSMIYNVKIEYRAAEISQMSFIGKIDKTDSLEKILNDIALLNNLQVTHTNSGYLVKKRKH